MNHNEAAESIRSWLDSERLEAREVNDPQAIVHLHVRYPPTKQGHLFNIVIPKKRNLVLLYSITRVDEGSRSPCVKWPKKTLRHGRNGYTIPESG